MHQPNRSGTVCCNTGTARMLFTWWRQAGRGPKHPSAPVISWMEAEEAEKEEEAEAEEEEEEEEEVQGLGGGGDGVSEGGVCQYMPRHTCLSPP